MINQLTGTVLKVKVKSITLLTGGVGFAINIPQVDKLELNKQATIFTYMHWNQDKGPQLYGFQEELERTIFLMIIDCPKIGPGLGLTILSQMSAGQFLEVVSSQSESALSALKGIGAKKAEQIITNLKHKVSKLLASGDIADQTSEGNFAQWQQLSDVLTSLNYSKPEITGAMQYLAKEKANENRSLDVMIRSALSHLSKQKMGSLQ